MAFDPSDLFYVTLIFLVAWFLLEYFDGGGGGKRIPVAMRG